MAETEEITRKFTDLCLKVERGIQLPKLKKFKFLLEEVVGYDVVRDKTFLEVITELESRRLLQRKSLRENGLLLCELLDAISLKDLADTIYDDLGIQRNPDYKSTISPYRKLLITLSDNLSHPRDLERMTRFLESYKILEDCSVDDTLEIFLAMEHARLMSPNDLTVLKKMQSAIYREDLVKIIDEFNKERGIRKVYGLRNLPADMIQRKPELDAVLNLLKSGNDRVGVVGIRSRDVVGIRGMGGIGKTVLAQAVAWNISSSRDVIWLDIGQDPDCLALVNTLVKALGGTRSFSDLPTAQAWIREDTENKNCLVVLDDVWNVDDADVFDVLAGKCQLLITTRDADVVRGLRGSAIHELGTMGKEEARKLLYQSAQVHPAELLNFGEKILQVVEGLLVECHGLPLALALVGSSLVDSRHEQDWQDVLDDLKNADLEAVRKCFPKDAYPYDHLLAAMDVSFQRLEPYHQEKFLDFSIFPEDTDIPSAILEMYWVSSNARQARNILNVLERRSLIQKGPTYEGKKTYRVHDLLLDFARGKLCQCGHRLSDVQTGFLEIFRRQCVDGEWSNFPEDNEYLFTYLPYHLCSAEKHGDLLYLFFDFKWLQRKVKVTSLASLISDFRFLGDASHESKILKSSLMLSADVLDKNPNGMGAQLLGRLASCFHKNPNVNRLLAQVREISSKKCLLIPLHTCLTEPDGPLIKIFTRHRGTVFSLATAYRVSGTIVVSASTDCLIKVNDLETGKELKVFSGHKMAVCCLALSHGETMVASGSYDTTVRIWNLDSYSELLALEGGGGYVNTLDFSKDDLRLFTGSNDGSLKVWRVSDGKLLHSIPAHEGHIRGLCTTLDGVFVATASFDQTIKLWNAKSLNLGATLKGHTDTVYAVTTTKDSNILVSASGDKNLKIWDLKTFQQLRTLSGHQEEIYSVGVTPDGKRVISGGKDMVVMLWCLGTGKLLYRFRGHSQSIRFVMVTPDGSKALSGSQDTTFRVWNLNVSFLKQSEFSGHSKDVMDVSMNDEGSICASSSMDGTLKIWCCETGKETITMRAHTRRAVSLAMSRDGAHVVSLAKDSLVKVWKVEDARMIASVEMSEPRLVRFNQTEELVLVGCENNFLLIWNWRNQEIRSVCLPAFTTMEMIVDGNTAYTCSSGAEVCQIDLANNNVSKVCQGPSAGYKSVVILPGGRAVLFGIAPESSFIYWEMSSTREISYNANHPRDALVTALDITRDNKLVLSGSSAGTLSLVHLETSEIIRRYDDTRGGSGVCFIVVLKNDLHFVVVDDTNIVELRRLDGSQRIVLGQPTSMMTSVCAIGSEFLLAGCKNGELVLFDTTGVRGSHQGHNGAVTRLASQAANQFLYFASGSENGTVKLWFLTDTNPPAWINIWFRENVHEYPVTALAFIPGSGDVVSGSYDNVVKRLNAKGVIQEFVFKCYDIAALCVVDDSLIATCVRSLSVVKWRLEDSCMLRRAHGGAGREQVARIFIPSGRVISKGSHHNLLYWDLFSGKEICRLSGHTHDIRALAFVPGGVLLLSGSRDKVLKLWNLETGDLVDEFHFERYVLAIACSSNGVVCVGLQGGQVCFLRVNLSKPTREEL